MSLPHMDGWLQYSQTIVIVALDKIIQNGPTLKLLACRGFSFGDNQNNTEII